MSRRFWLNFTVFALFLIAIILSILGLTLNLPALAVVALVLAALAIVGYNYLIVNPILLENAKRSARELCEAGQIVDPGLHEKLCSRLARAPADPEAAELHRKLTDLKANSQTPAAPGES